MARRKNNFVFTFMLHERRKHMRKKLTLLGFMLVTTGALILPGEPTNAYGKVCDDCRIQCGSDAQELYWDCVMANGGHETQACYNSYISAHSNCQSVFCVPLGCPIQL